ncbi:hypothetical protein D3C72_2211580 [compost metagenome]
MKRAVVIGRIVLVEACGLHLHNEPAVNSLVKVNGLVRYEKKPTNDGKEKKNQKKACITCE